MGEVGERLDLRPIEVEGIAHFTERLERGAIIFGACGVAEPREADGPRRPDIMPAIGQAGSQRDAVPLAARIGTEVIAVGLARRAARIDVGLHMAIAAGQDRKVATGQLWARLRSKAWPIYPKALNVVPSDSGRAVSLNPAKPMVRVVRILCQL